MDNAGCKPHTLLTTTHLCYCTCPSAAPVQMLRRCKWLCELLSTQQSLYSQNRNTHFLASGNDQQNTNLIFLLSQRCPESAEAL